MVDMIDAVDMPAQSIAPPFHMPLDFVILFERNIFPDHIHQYRRYKQTFTKGPNPPRLVSCLVGWLLRLIVVDLVGALVL